MSKYVIMQGEALEAYRKRRNFLYEQKLGGNALLLTLGYERSKTRIEQASVWTKRRLDFEQAREQFLTDLDALFCDRNDMLLDLMRAVASRTLVQPQGVALSGLSKLRTNEHAEISAGDAIRKLMDVQMLEQVQGAKDKYPAFRPTQLCLMTVLERQGQMGFWLESASDYDPGFDPESLRAYVSDPEVLDLSSLPSPSE